MESHKQLPFYSANEAFGETYYQLPKVFYTSPLYKPLSNDAKVAFAILKSHFSYSVMNHWVDEDNHIFFTYTNERMKDMLGCQDGKLSKIKKELIQAGLLSQVHVGLNQPNRLYLHKPETSAEDVYQIAREDRYIADSAPVTQSESLQTLDNSGRAKIARPGNAANKGRAIFARPVMTQSDDSQTLGNSGHAKIAHELELYSSRDLTRDLLETATADSSNTASSTPKKGAEQNQPLKPAFLPEQDDALERMLLDNFADSIDPAVSGDILSRSSLQLIGKWSHTVKEARERVGVILNAKRDAELEYDTYLVTEDLQDELNKALLRVVMRWKDQLDGRSERSIRNVDNYLYGAMKQIFENESVRQLNLQAKDDADRAALRDLQDRFADARTGKQARMEAREVNRARRRQREHKQANA